MHKGSRTPHEVLHDKRPARKSCGTPSESRPSRKPQSTQPESVAGPQAHHHFRRARQAANRRHASEAKTTRYHGASRGPTPWWWFPLCTRTIKRRRYPACTARISSSKRAAWMQRGSRSRFPSSSKGSSTRAALFRKQYALNDILEAYRAFEAREDGWPQSRHHALGRTLTRHGRKARQEGHDKGPDYPHERRTLQPIDDKSEKCATTNVTTTANSWPHDGRRGLIPISNARICAEDVE